MSIIKIKFLKKPKNLSEWSHSALKVVSYTLLYFLTPCNSQTSLKFFLNHRTSRKKNKVLILTPNVKNNTKKKLFKIPEEKKWRWLRHKAYRLSGKEVIRLGQGGWNSAFYFTLSEVTTFSTESTEQPRALMTLWMVKKKKKKQKKKQWCGAGDVKRIQTKVEGLWNELSNWGSLNSLDNFSLFPPPYPVLLCHPLFLLPFSFWRESLSTIFAIDY